MKDKIKNIFRKDNCGSEGSATLWALYSGQQPSFMRLGALARKNNFANIIIPLNGVNISLGTRSYDKPIESAPRMLQMNPDTVRFDSHFESGNLLYAYRK